MERYVPPGGEKPETLLTPPLKTSGYILPKTKTVNVPIIFYHYIEYNHDPKDTIRMHLTVTPYWLEKQLRFLRDNGYTTVDLNQVRAAIMGRKDLPPKPVVISFDDGYRDFYTDAYPLLKKYQAKATIYVISDFLDRPNYMFTWQLKEIATESANLITIGAHTRHHLSLTSVSEKIAWDEISGSKTRLEAIISRPVVHFAYPYGFYNQAVADLVKKAGFWTATTTVPGTREDSSNFFSFPRIRIGDYDGKFFESRLRVTGK